MAKAAAPNRSKGQARAASQAQPQAQGHAQAQGTFLDLVAATVPLFAAALEAHRQGQLSRARSAYLELMDQPNLTAVCLHQLGVVAGQQGDHKRAAELFQRAIRIDGGQPMFYQNLSVSLERLGNKGAALDALIDLGCALQKGELHDQAIPVYRRILEADPCRYAAYVNMGTGLAWLGDTRNAVPALIKGAVLHAEVKAELKVFLADLLPSLIAGGAVPPDIGNVPGPPTGRVEMIEHALASLGKALTELGFHEEAMKSYRMAVETEPGLALAHWNLSLGLLSEGDFAQGWREYEWRWRWDKFPDPHRRLPVPEWRGQPLAGKTVVVYAEQGYGDTIQFAPLARRLAEQAGEVLFEVTTPQVRLFKEGFAGGNLEVVERTRNPDIIATLKPYHYVVPLMSLPARLSLSLGDLPLCGPYIKPPTAARAQWAKRFAGAKGCKIGLAWAGRPTHAEDRKRSLTLERLRALFLVQGISWYSLQVGPASAQIAETKLPLVNLAPHFNDFADTAAAIIELDVVIAVDTAVAHLGAAMGKSVWILLPAVADWRWLQARADSPWYSSVRLFRQPRIGDWDSVVAEVLRALTELVR